MMKIITSDLENVILTASPRKGMVTFIHSLKNFGGTLRRPDNKVIGLQGFGRHASAVEIDVESLVQTTKFHAPHL